MFCLECGKKIKENEKFCTNCGKSTSFDANEKDFPAISTTGKFNLFNNLVQFLKFNKQSIKSWVKNIALFLCLYFLFQAILDGMRGGYSYSDENVLLALAPTILTIFVWKKISKRFNL